MIVESFKDIDFISDVFDLKSLENEDVLLVSNFSGSEKEIEVLTKAKIDDEELKEFMLNFFKLSHLLEDEPGLFRGRLKKITNSSIKVSFIYNKKSISCLIYKSSNLEIISSNVNSLDKFRHFSEKLYSCLKIFVENRITPEEKLVFSKFFLQMIEVFNRKNSDKKFIYKNFNLTSKDTFPTVEKVNYLANLIESLYNSKNGEFLNEKEYLLEHFKDIDIILNNVLWREILSIDI